ALTPARRRRSRRRHIAPPFPRQARVLPGVPPRRRPGRRGMSPNQPCAAILPDRLIVVGDLHLGEGATPVRGRVSGEHFFHDREFASWLRRLSSHGARRGRRLELVLNGDAFDFLRVIRLPDGPRGVAAWRQLLRAAGVGCAPDRLRAAAVAPTCTSSMGTKWIGSLARSAISATPSPRGCACPSARSSAATCSTYSSDGCPLEPRSRRRGGWWRRCSGSRGASCRPS